MKEIIITVILCIYLLILLLASMEGIIDKDIENHESLSKKRDDK